MVMSGGLLCGLCASRPCFSLRFFFLGATFSAAQPLDGGGGDGGGEGEVQVSHARVGEGGQEFSVMSELPLLSKGILSLSASARAASSLSFLIL